MRIERSGCNYFLHIPIAVTLEFKSPFDNEFLLRNLNRDLLPAQALNNRFDAGVKRGFERILVLVDPRQHRLKIGAGIVLALDFDEAQAINIGTGPVQIGKSFDSSHVHLPMHSMRAL